MSPQASGSANATRSLPSAAQHPKNSRQDIAISMVNATGTNKTSKQLHLVVAFGSNRIVVQTKMSFLGTLATGKWTMLLV